MNKTLLITGASDGIGLETAKKLVSMGHKVLLHGRNQAKLQKIVHQLNAETPHCHIESYIADLSHLSEVEKLAGEVLAKNKGIDILINNAGVYVTPQPIGDGGIDVRFMVNTIAPYLLTKRLLPHMNNLGRVINLSSAAQASVNPQALIGEQHISSDSLAYAQSKLALTMWSHSLALAVGDNGPAIIAVNPKSMLGSKMVRDAYGVSGGDLSIGADILCKASLSDQFANASGQYFDNDIGIFTRPHPDAINHQKCQEIITLMDRVLDSRDC